MTTAGGAVARAIRSIRQRDAGLTPMPIFLGLMFLASTANMADRQVIGVVAEYIKREFGLTDTMVSLISGTAFALVYPPLGLPLAMLADRVNRKRLLAVCLTFWSFATIACGLAPGFVGLLLARAGVAIGEAGYAPTTHALIADYTSESRRARAYSVLLLGISAGGLFAATAGGLAAQAFGWRAAFLAVGVPGLVIALLIHLLVREPPRSQGAQSSHGPRGALLRLLSTPAFSFCVAGSALHLMVAYGAAAWTMAYFIRFHHLEVARAAFLIGGLGAATGGVGTIIGGFVGDRLGAYDRRWLAWWPAVTVLAAAALGAPAYLAGSATLALIGVATTVFLNTLYQPATYALVQSVARPDERATAAGLMIFIQNMVGLGLGPLAVGLMSDHLAAAYGARALGISLALLFLLNIAAAAAYGLSGASLRRTPAETPS